MSAIMIAAIVVAATGIVVGFGLGIFGEKFKVEVDPREAEIREALPGNNCGGCGYPGCDGCAKAINEGNAPVNACPVGQKPCWDAIAAIMGVEAGDAEKKVAFVKCAGTCEVAPKRYNYSGPDDCNNLGPVPGSGDKACNFGCLGHGSCVKACQFDAMHIVDGIAKVDESKCTGCQACIKVCPRKLIELVPASAKYRVNCANKDKGKAVMEVCKVGCIACTMCTKVCQNDAIHMNGNIAEIDYEKCIGCGLCAEKCPKKIIHMFQETA